MQVKPARTVIAGLIASPFITAVVEVSWVAGLVVSTAVLFAIAYAFRDDWTKGDSQQ